MLVTRQDGSGKSFILNSLRQLLGQCCVVVSYFGIASQNINGVALHSFLKLLIHGRNCSELKGSFFADMGARMTNICYLTIDAFFLIGERIV